MKIKLIAAFVTGIYLSTTGFASDTPNAGKPKTDVEKLSYSIGADLGKNFKRQNIQINVSAISQGLTDSLNDKPLMMTDEEMRNVLISFQKDLIAKRNAEFSKKSQENKEKGEAFLAANKAKPGVMTLASGLQYKILEKGNGKVPGKDDVVTVEYTGKLINGDVFDSTEKNGKAATFQVSQVIPGWTEALQLMPAGSTWEVYIPSNLAYGPRSVGGPIGPNEVLVFKIRLLDVKNNSKA